jgi:geranylgeranyl diphosphate synthase type II
MEKVLDIKEYLKEQSQFINEKLNDLIPTGEPKILFDSIKYSLTAGGKRIRPILVLESAKAVGYENVNNILDIAIATEFIHTYSLIHDDLPSMDNDDLRRGKPTNHKIFGEAIAILAGDGLLTYAFEIISKNKNIEPSKLLKVINVLSNGVGIYGMVGGQAADILAEEGNFKDIEFIHLHKTAKFLESCCLIGGILGNADEEQQKALKDYGMYIGLAFQIQDDILDEIGNSEKLGKSVGKDKEKNKLTFPSIYGLEKSKEIAQKYLNNALKSIQNLKNREILEQIAKFIVEREV